MRNSILLIGLLLSVSVLSLRIEEQSNMSSEYVMQKLAKVEESEYGRMILDTVSLQVESGNIMDDIVGLLNKAKDELIDAQKKADDRYASDKAQCETEQKDYNDKINAAQAAIDGAEAELANVLLPHKAYLEGQIKLTREAIAVNVANQARLTATRKLEHAAFLVRMNDHATALSACSEAIPEVKKLLNSGASLIEIHSAKTRIEEFVQIFGQIKTNYSFYPLVQTLVQLTLSKNFSNQDVVARLLEIFEQLQKNLTDSQKMENDHENQLQHNFEVAIDDLKEERRNLDKKLGELQADLAVTNSNIIKQRGIVKVNTAKRDHNKDLLKKSIARCHALWVIYDKTTKKRNEELEVIATVTEIFVKMNNNMRGYLKERINKSTQ